VRRGQRRQQRHRALDTLIVCLATCSISHLDPPLCK
jgi:hypothetical protein